MSTKRLVTTRAGCSPLIGLPLIAFAMAGLAGCGGTSSETPWPVEPDDVDLRPNADKPPMDRAGATSGAAVAQPPESEEPTPTDASDPP